MRAAGNVHLRAATTHKTQALLLQNVQQDQLRSTTPEAPWPGLPITGLMLLFVLLVLPLAAAFVFYYPDERHYTDGALQMLQTGDWLTPRTAEGEPRLIKPVLTYWLVAASFKLFGVGVLQARLPFLIICTLTLYALYRFARDISGREPVARMAALLLASHPQFILTASRSMPDALLFLGLVLSLHGFARLIFNDARDRGSYWLAYGGAALAALSKGLWGLTPILWACAFQLAQRRTVRALRTLVHFPAAVTCVGIALAWFAYVWAVHGGAGLQSFYADQIGQRHSNSVLFSAGLLLAGVAVLAFNFLPWSLPALELALRREKPAAHNAIPRPIAWFLLGWGALNVVTVALGNSISTRYYVISAPALAALIGWMLIREPSAQLVFGPKTIHRLTLTASVICICCSGLLSILKPEPIPGTHINPAVTACAGLAVLCVLVWALPRVPRLTHPDRTALALLVMFGWLGAMPSLTGMRDKACQITHALKSLGQGATNEVLFVGRPPVASRVRVCSHGQIRIRAVPSLNAIPGTNRCPVVAEAELAPALAARGYTLVPAGTGIELRSPRHWFQIYRQTRSLKEMLYRTEVYYVAVRAFPTLGRGCP